MPKEHVTDERTQLRAYVGWERDRDMSIAVTTPGESSIFWQLLAGGSEPGSINHGAVIELARAVEAVFALYPIPQYTSDDPASTLNEREDRERQEALDARGQAILNCLDRQARGVDAGGLFSSLWFPIDDRRTVNKLIRLLRKARDQAFGADA